MSFDKCTVVELKKLISPKKYFKKTGDRISRAKKQNLIDYLNQNGEDKQEKSESESKSKSNIFDEKTSHDGYLNNLFDEKSVEKPKVVETCYSEVLTNKQQVLKPPKLDNFQPDPDKLQKIREKLPPKEEAEPIELSEEKSLDEDDKDHLRKIIGCEIESNYEYHELSEIKMKKYVQIYPTLKPILSSTDFKNSKEKLEYMEYMINSTKFNANITDLLFTTTSYIERNQFIGQYVNLRGYTKTLAQRKQEIELLIEELKIKHMEDVGEYLAWPVEARLALLLAQTALNVHLVNEENAQKKK